MSEFALRGVEQLLTSMHVEFAKICEYESLPCHRIHTTLHRYTADYETLP